MIRKHCRKYESILQHMKKEKVVLAMKILLRSASGRAGNPCIQLLRSSSIEARFEPPKGNAHRRQNIIGSDRVGMED